MPNPGRAEGLSFALASARPSSAAGARYSPEKTGLAELRARGGAEETFERVLAEIELRDHNDSTRAYMPLRLTEDSVLLDTSDLTVEEALSAMLAAIAAKRDATCST